MGCGEKIDGKRPVWCSLKWEQEMVIKKDKVRMCLNSGLYWMRRMETAAFRPDVMIEHKDHNLIQIIDMACPRGQNIKITKVSAIGLWDQGKETSSIPCQDHTSGNWMREPEVKEQIAKILKTGKKEMTGLGKKCSRRLDYCTTSKEEEWKHHDDNK